MISGIVGARAQARMLTLIRADPMAEHYRNIVSAAAGHSFGGSVAHFGQNTGETELGFSPDSESIPNIAPVRKGCAQTGAWCAQDVGVGARFIAPSCLYAKNE